MDSHLTKEELASRLGVIPEEYMKLAKRVFNMIGEKRVVEILKASDQRVHRSDVRRELGVSLFAVNVAFDALELMRLHQMAKPAPKRSRPPGAKAFITGANKHLLVRGKVITVNGKAARIETPPSTKYRRGQNGTIIEFEYRLLGASPEQVTKGTLDSDCVIFLR